MSLILDALRRADAQRERDSSRGIHAQSGPLPGPVGQRSRLQTALWWGLPAVVLAGLSAAGWQWRAHSAQPQQRSAAAAPGEEVAGPLTSAIVVADAIRPEPAAARAPSPMRRVAAPAMAPPTPQPSPPDAAAVPGRPDAPDASGNPADARFPGVQAPADASPAAPERNAPQPASAPPARPSTVSPQPAPRTPGPSSGAAAADRRSPLPADAPAFNLSGGVYSRNPAQRMVIVNGQVFGEGSEPVAGVVVEEIRRQSAVVRFRDKRYTLTY